MLSTDRCGSQLVLRFALIRCDESRFSKLDPVTAQVESRAKFPSIYLHARKASRNPESADMTSACVALEG